MGVCVGEWVGGKARLLEEASGHMPTELGELLVRGLPYARPLEHLEKDLQHAHLQP